MGVTDFALEITFPEEHPKSERIGFRYRAIKAAVPVSPNILQLDLRSEMLSAKYCLNVSITKENLVNWRGS